MSEDSVIFLAEVNSSQVDNKSAVQAAVSPSPFVVPEENVAGERGEESPVGGPDVPVEVGVVVRPRRALKLIRRTRMRTSMLLAAWTKLGCLDMNLKDSRCQRSFVARDWGRMCPSVSLTLLTFHNVSFQIFIDYH